MKRDARFFFEISVVKGALSENFPNCMALINRIYGVIGCMGALVLFKYSGFLLNSMYVLTGYEGFLKILPKGHSIILPLGVSFYSVQGISGVIDRWRDLRRYFRLLEDTGITGLGVRR